MGSGRQGTNVYRLEVGDLPGDVRHELVDWDVQIEESATRTLGWDLVFSEDMVGDVIGALERSSVEIYAGGPAPRASS